MPSWKVVMASLINGTENRVTFDTFCTLHQQKLCQLTLTESYFLSEIHYWLLLMNILKCILTIQFHYKSPYTFCWQEFNSQQKVTLKKGMWSAWWWLYHKVVVSPYIVKNITEILHFYSKEQCILALKTYWIILPVPFQML